jgi:hypothetical protein
MLLAYGEGSQQVLPHHVHRAAADTPAAAGAGKYWLPYGYALVVVLIGVAAWVSLR